MKRTSGSFGVVAGVLVALLSHGTAAKADFIGLSGDFAGIHWWLNADQTGSTHEVGNINMSAGVSSSLHRIDWVNLELQPRYEGAPNEWTSYFNTGGVRNQSLNPAELSSSFTFNLPDVVYINQNVGKSYTNWEGEVPTNYSHGHIYIAPARIDWCGGNYNQYVDDYDGLTHWNILVRCDGDFGEGPQGLAAAEAVFGTPEPGSLALLGLGAVATIRRRR